MCNASGPSRENLWLRSRAAGELLNRQARVADRRPKEARKLLLIGSRASHKTRLCAKQRQSGSERGICRALQSPPPQLRLDPVLKFHLGLTDESTWGPSTADRPFDSSGTQRCNKCMMCNTIHFGDTMFSIRLEPEIERRLSELAKRTGQTKTYYARELIESNLDDLEDRCLLIGVKMRRV